MTIFLNHIVSTNEKFLEKTSFHDKLHLKKKNSNFSPKPWTILKTLPVSNFFNFLFYSLQRRFFFYFLDNIGKENVFYDILERKNVSLSCKNKKLKKSKN